MAILAMTFHGQDARATPPCFLPSAFCLLPAARCGMAILAMTYTGKMPVPRLPCFLPSAYCLLFSAGRASKGLPS